MKNSIELKKSSKNFRFTSGLDHILSPFSVAVIGASSSFAKWGQMILCNIVAANFQGRVFPVNPKEEMIFGLPAYKKGQDIPEPIDLALITTPAERVAQVLRDCGEKGVKGVVVISSGFGETDDRGKRLQTEIVSICHEGGMALVGPNTMGIIAPHAGLLSNPGGCGQCACEDGCLSELSDQLEHVTSSADLRPVCGADVKGPDQGVTAATER
ncbi:MAG: CoA-binding protein [Proteobacteria bacterium]|nr:CoA-binding protein [Pseudomonadota bacterium]